MIKVFLRITLCHTLTHSCAWHGMANLGHGLDRGWCARSCCGRGQEIFAFATGKAKTSVCLLEITTKPYAPSFE